MGEPTRNLGSPSDSAKDALIFDLRAKVADLTAKVAELEARLGASPKTPANSSLPSSRREGEQAGSAREAQAQRAPSSRREGEQAGSAREAQAQRAGAGLKLHRNPDAAVEVCAESRPHCRKDLDGAEQTPQAVYERIELRSVRPHVTRVALRRQSPAAQPRWRPGAWCRNCGKERSMNADSVGRG